MTLFLGGILKKAGDVVKGAAKGFIGSGGNPIGAITGGISGVLGDGGGGGGSPQVTQPGGASGGNRTFNRSIRNRGRVGRAPQMTTSIAPTSPPPDVGTHGSRTSIDFPSMSGPLGGFDLGGINRQAFGDSNDEPTSMQQSGGGGAMQGTFSNALVSQMLTKKVRGKAGRAILEAMQAGSLQDGMIQQPYEVDTPRGVEYHSPPGFRTVTLNGQKISVFKPLAMALNLLPKTSTTKITSADMKKITDVNRLTKKLKRLGKKTGNLKITNK